MFLKRAGAVLLAVVAIAFGTNALAARAQDTGNDIVRRARSKVQPAYPDLARKMKLAGTVKVQVVVSPNGTVKEAKVVGGHPVLANAALEAARKWRFDPSATETTGVVDFKFEVQQ